MFIRHVQEMSNGKKKVKCMIPLHLFSFLQCAYMEEEEERYQIKHRLHALLFPHSATQIKKTLPFCFTTSRKITKITWHMLLLHNSTIECMPFYGIRQPHYKISEHFINSNKRATQPYQNTKHDKKRNV